MYCENCGNRLEDGHKFCTKCGHSTLLDAPKKSATTVSQTVIHNDKWWHRLFKVAYIFLYIQILWIVPVVWSSYVPSCYASYSCYGSYSEAFWYSLLAFVIYMVVLRLIKIAVFYVMMGQNPEWRREFKKIF